MTTRKKRKRSRADGPGDAVDLDDRGTKFQLGANNEAIMTQRHEELVSSGSTPKIRIRQSSSENLGAGQVHAYRQVAGKGNAPSATPVVVQNIHHRQTTGGGAPMGGQRNLKIRINTSGGIPTMMNQGQPGQQAMTPNMQMTQQQQQQLILQQQQRMNQQRQKMMQMQAMQQQQQQQQQQQAHHQQHSQRGQGQQQGGGSGYMYHPSVQPGNGGQSSARHAANQVKGSGHGSQGHRGSSGHSKALIEDALKIVSQPIQPPSPGSVQKKKKKRSERLTSEELVRIVHNPYEQPTAAFWKDLQQYFDPLTDEHMKLLKLRDLDREDGVFDIPALGQHYSEIWAMEDEISWQSSRQARYAKKEKGGSRRGAPASLDSNASASMSIEMSETEEGLDDDMLNLKIPKEIDQHTLSQRMLSSLVTSHIVPVQQESSSIMMKLEQDEEEELSKEESLFSDRQAVTTEQDLEQIYGTASTTKQAKGRSRKKNTSRSKLKPGEELPDSKPLEERMRMELEAIGLLDGQDEPLLEHQDRQDDELCCRIRYLQKALKRQVERNNVHRAKLLNTIKATAPYHRRAMKVNEKDKEVEKVFARRMLFQEDHRDGLLTGSESSIHKKDRQLLHEVREALEAREKEIRGVPLIAMLPYVYFSQPPNMGPGGAGAKGFIDGNGFAYGAKHQSRPKPQQSNGNTAANGNKGKAMRSPGTPQQQTMLTQGAQSPRVSVNPLPPGASPSSVAKTFTIGEQGGMRMK